jgi:hypothetical protein
MMTTPSKESSFFSVNKNRYDDFVALHANATAGGMRSYKSLSYNHWLTLFYS